MNGNTAVSNLPSFLRREAAANYLLSRYGFGTKASLDKWACCGGGPRFRKIGRFPVYEARHLDEWALQRLGGLQTSTSDLTGASNRDFFTEKSQIAK